MALTLSLTKPGDNAPKLSLNLTKDEVFSIELFWDSKHDLDAHALLATNVGNGAKITGLEQILSTYNKKTGAITVNSNGSFQTPEGGLIHSGDALTGDAADVDEVITVNTAKVPKGVNEIPVFVTIHPAATATFGEVDAAGIRIKNGAGVIIAEYHLSDEFAEFDAIQMGTFVNDASSGWSYIAAGSGFNGNFNDILAFFS